MTEMKYCRRCDTIKPLDEFHRRARSPDGVQSYCKPCQIQFAQDTRDRVLNNICSKTYHERHRDKRRAQSRKDMRKANDRNRKRPYAPRLHMRKPLCGD